MWDTLHAHKPQNKLLAKPQLTPHATQGRTLAAALQLIYLGTACMLLYSLGGHLMLLIAHPNTLAISDSSLPCVIDDVALCT